MEGRRVDQLAEWWKSLVYMNQIVDLKITSPQAAHLSLWTFLRAFVHTKQVTGGGTKLLLPRLQNLSLDRFCARSSVPARWSTIPGLLKSALEMRTEMQRLEMLFCSGEGLAGRDVEVLRGLVPFVQYTEAACGHFEVDTGD